MMASSEAYQFKVTLAEVKPQVWRRIVVPHDYSFWDLHVAIQDAMGWLDYHLHEFQIKDPATGLQLQIGIPDPDLQFDEDTEAGWELKIADFFGPDNQKATYLYDFGDGWRHQIRFEKVLSDTAPEELPVCLAGERSGPPEDVGGPHGYEMFLEALGDRSHERHEELSDWIGGSFDPEAFQADQIIFDDPQERWRLAFGED